MPYITIDGLRYYYAGELGKPGIPIIFCHGSGGGHHHWIFQLNNLSSPINPIAIDLPGHGHSEGFPKDTVSANSDWIHHFKEAAGIEKFILAGHSLGGAITIDYSLRYPEHLAGIVLIGTGGRLKVLPAILETFKNDDIPEEMSAYLYGPDISDDLLKKARREIESTPTSVFYTDLNACNQFDVMDELSSIAIPALIICGDKDRLTPQKYSQYLKKQIPNSRIEIINNAGHMVMVEKPDAVNTAITHFAKEL